MHSPLSTQAFAQLRDACGPWPVRRISMIPAMTARGSPLTSPGPVTGQTSTHLPQRVQASAIAATRPASAASKVSVMWALGKAISCRGRLRASLSRHCDALDLDHHFRLRKALHGYGGAGGKIAAEKLGAQLGHARGMAGIAEKHRHGHHVAQLGAGLLQRLLDVAE